MSAGLKCEKLRGLFAWRLLSSRGRISGQLCPPDFTECTDSGIHAVRWCDVGVYGKNGIPVASFRMPK